MTAPSVAARRGKQDPSQQSSHKRRSVASSPQTKRLSHPRIARLASRRSAFSQQGARQSLLSSPTKAVSVTDLTASFVFFRSDLKLLYFCQGSMHSLSPCLLRSPPPKENGGTIHPTQEPIPHKTVLPSTSRYVHLSPAW